MAEELEIVRTEGQNKGRGRIHHSQAYLFDATSGLLPRRHHRQEPASPGEVRALQHRKNNCRSQCHGFWKAIKPIALSGRRLNSFRHRNLVAPVPSKTLLAGERSGGYGGSDGMIELQVAGTVRPASMCRFPSSNSENLAVQLAC